MKINESHKFNPFYPDNNLDYSNACIPFHLEYYLGNNLRGHVFLLGNLLAKLRWEPKVSTDITGISQGTPPSQSGMVSELGMSKL